MQLEEKVPILDSIKPCYSAFAVSSNAPIASIACNQLYDCLQGCLTNIFTLGGIGPSPSTSQNVSAPATSSCPTKNTTAYFVVTENEIAGTTNGQTIPYDQENQCVGACTDQTNPANGASLPCKSFVVLPKAKQCLVTTVAGPPDGTGNLKPNVDAVYAQKFCLPANSPSYCFEQFFFLFPQKDFIGHTMNTAKAANLAACAGLCTTTLNCKAAVYDSSSQDCTLKNDNAINSTSDLRSGASTTYYVENGCLLGQKSSATIATALAAKRLTVIRTSEKAESVRKIKKEQSIFEWSDWSPCQYKVQGHKSRVRTASNCSNLRKCPSIEYEHCD
uniref:Apple domain-containing protein n=1 Tax=Romanomermis culicivorax TaxID=13658 RepID=A0A915K755_ROMCU